MKSLDHLQNTTSLPFLLDLSYQLSSFIVFSSWLLQINQNQSYSIIIKYKWFTGYCDLISSTTYSTILYVITFLSILEVSIKYI
jgi:hypothetical protein